MDFGKKIFIILGILLGVLFVTILSILFWWKDFDNRRMIRNYGKTYVDFIKNYGQNTKKIF